MMVFSGLIRPNVDGATFTRVQDRERGVIEAVLLEIHDDDGTLIDVAAWERSRPQTWWLHRGVVTVIGEKELTWAWYDERAPYLVETPADFIACDGRAACILDWTTRIDDFLHGLKPAICNTERLRIRIERTLAEQSRSPLSGRIQVGTRAEA
jgi:hypothetical protein